MNSDFPVRYNWSADYRGKALVVYGHTPVPEPLWLNNTVNIDTGCVFGGRLTALRYPEREIVTVPARATYYESRKPFLPVEDLAPRAAQHAADDVLDIDDVVGKRLIDTRLQPRVTIRAENAIVALEVMSRFSGRSQNGSFNWRRLPCHLLKQRNYPDYLSIPTRRSPTIGTRVFRGSSANRNIWGPARL